MKVYYLRLTQDDFAKSGLDWTSEVIDLYENDSYVNYSTTKSNYGQDPLDNHTWVGMEVDGSNTSSGRIEDGRFIDHTGRINLINYSITVDGLPGTGVVDTYLDVYTIDDSTIDYPDGWASKLNIADNRGIYLIDSYRYARFVVHFDTEQTVAAADVELVVRVEIDTPVMTPLYESTRRVLNKFPEWMEMRKLDGKEPAVPELAEPQSIGGQLINAVAGEWLEELEDDIDYLRIQHYVTTADTSQVAWVWFASDVPNAVYSVEGDGTTLASTVNIHEFYELTDDEDGYYWEEGRNALYVRKPYETLLINGEAYPIKVQHIWNWFDEHGAVLDLFRHREEDNTTFKARILDVYKNQPGVGVEAFRRALRRELNLWLASAEDIDSEAATALPTLLEIEDIETHPDFVTEDGLPKQKFIDLVENLAELYPSTWGYFRWDRARWDLSGDANESYGLLPYQYDPPMPTEIQAGVGDIEDLYIHRPEAFTGPREFEARFKIRGRTITTENQYPPVRFNVEVFGAADKEMYTNPTVTKWATVRIINNDGTFYLPVQVSATSDVDVDNPTPTTNSYGIIDFISEDGFSQVDDTWYMADGTVIPVDEEDPQHIDLLSASSIAVRWGRFDPTTQTFVDNPADSSATMWFSHNDAATLTSTGASTWLESTDLTMDSDVVVQSNETDFSVQRWETEHEVYEIILNDSPSGDAEEDFVLEIPDIVWGDDFLDGDGNKTYEIQVTTIDETGTAVVETQNPNSDTWDQLPVSLISLNGSNAWVDGRISIDETTSPANFTFSTGTVTGYPVAVNISALYEATQLMTIPGVVDENGPWRNGVPQPDGSEHYAVGQYELDRSDFGIASNATTTVEWIDVELVDGDDVVVWIDSNYVASDDSENVPENAVIEDNGSSPYFFSPIILRARIKPGIDPEWKPKMNSGWFYIGNEEYYAFADAEVETHTATDFVLETVPRQGAPIVLKDEDTPGAYRQVSFFDTETATLSLTNTHTVKGSGANRLYLPFEDVFGVTVVDAATGDTVTAGTSTATNILTTTPVTDTDKDYIVSYMLNKSFIADHDNITAGENRTRIQVADMDVGLTYEVAYEKADFDSASVVDVPLHSFYTSIDEGFLFLSNDEYPLATIDAYLSPSKIVADGEDYTMITLKSLDEHGNPKPDQDVTLTTDFGTFSNSTNTIIITTGADGSASTVLTSEEADDVLEATLTVTGSEIVDTELTFQVDPAPVLGHRLVAVTSAQEIPADGESQITVFGKVEGPDRQPVPGAEVTWRKARSMAEAFEAAVAGTVVADSMGRFVVGPLTAAATTDPGYWFVVVESSTDGTTPYDTVGDVVFWLEHPDYKYGANDANTLPIQLVQMRNNPYDYSFISDDNAFPVQYDEADPQGSVSAVTIDYEVPQWYAINRYKQYQLGFLGTGFYSVDLAALPDVHPDYKDV